MKKGFILFVSLGLNKFVLWISFTQWKMQTRASAKRQSRDNIQNKEVTKKTTVFYVFDKQR